MNVEQPHRDCRNFAPLDVVKGICHLTEEIILAGTPSCFRFERLPRCHSCSHYKTDGVTMGVGECGASPQAFMAYGEMAASTCASYRE